MDPPENSVNRFGRTIWTVWGYLSGAVARYLRPEVTAEGNQSVRARTEEIDVKSAVNKTDREVKTNNSDSENDRTEVKCSPSKVRAAASVQWENTGVVENGSNDKHVHTTEKQTHHCAAWSTGTDTDREGHTAQKDSSDEVQTEEEQESEERETSQELEITGKTEQKDGDNKEECEDSHEGEKREDTDVMLQSEQDEEQDKRISTMDHGETEDTRGLKPADEHPTDDETEKQDIVQKNQEKTESDEDQGTESQVQGLLEYLTDEANNISEFSKRGVEEMMLGSEQDEDTTERERDMTKYESTETLQRESESEKHAPNDEEELRMTTAATETIEALEDTLLKDSEQDASENTPESGTGSSTKTEGMFSDLTLCEFPAEPRRGLETDRGCCEEIQTPADSDETKHGTETLIQTDRTELSLKQHVEFRTELIVETKISSEDEEAEALEAENRSPVIRNVTLQPHELLEFTERQYKSSQGTMDTFSETQGDASVSETEDRADVKPVSMRSLSPTELLEEPRDVEKTALEYVEGITNQVLKEVMDTETELLEGLSAEDPGDAEHQAPAQCVSAGAPVLEEEQKILADAVDSSEEHTSSAEREGPEADEQVQKSIAGETVWRSHEDLMEVSRSGIKRAFDQVSTGLPETKTEGRFDLILQAFEDSSLDFSVQKCRIAVKNPLVRPPKDPRKLLFRASVEPLGQTLRGSAPNKALIGIKLPGLGAGLRKTGQKTEAERTLQQMSVTDDSVKQEQVPAKPKWTPPRHPGMGSPFMMAELKNKLKKPVQE